MGRKGQVALFVILAIVIVGAIVVLVTFRTNIFGVSGIPAEFLPVYNLYDSCIKEETEIALDVLGSQGGRIDVGDYTPGSDYMPFSSHLIFMGTNIPYWYTISGNGLAIENVPSKSGMEKEVSEFISRRVNDCDFSSFYEQGFYIKLGEPRVVTTIGDESVSVEVNSELSVSKGDSSARRTVHSAEVNSRIGRAYSVAKDIYKKELESGFFEEYGVDVLRNYAPVDGVKIQCSPEIWKTSEVVDDLQDGLEANFRQIKFRGDYYDLSSKDSEYFVVDLGDKVSGSVQVLYSRDWPNKIEVTPADETFMIAKPIGNQEGLGVMGFCYVPYHFVYDINFPVLIQISEGEEIFQFPMAVIIDNNLPKESGAVYLQDLELESNVCDIAEGDARIYTYDSNLNPVEADIKFECLSESCSLGKTKLDGNDAVLDTSISQCVNGFLVASAEGFAETKQLFSSNSESVADIILDKEYELEVELRIDGRVSEGNAIVSFDSERGIASAILPGSNKISLTEDLYNVSVFVYGNSSIVIPASTRTQCTEVSRGGIAGLFGGTKEECFNIEIPETAIDSALISGGKQEVYLLESELERGKMIIDVDSLPKPDSLEQLQINFEIFNTKGVEISFI